MAFYKYTLPYLQKPVIKPSGVKCNTLKSHEFIDWFGILLWDSITFATEFYYTASRPITMKCSNIHNGDNRFFVMDLEQDPFPFEKKKTN